MTICLIDDSKIFRFTVKKLLKVVSYEGEILEFGDGKEALEHFKKVDGDKSAYPSFILLDINMPKMNGFEFLEGFNDLEVAKETTVHMLTSSIDKVDMSRADDFDCVDRFIHKPLQKPVIEDLLLKHAE